MRRLEHGDKIAMCNHAHVDNGLRGRQPVRVFAREDGAPMDLLRSEDGEEVSVKYIVVCDACFSRCVGDPLSLKDMHVGTWKCGSSLDEYSVVRS